MPIDTDFSLENQFDQAPDQAFYLEPGTITREKEAGNFDITKPDMGLDIEKLEREQRPDYNYKQSFWEDPSNVYRMQAIANNIGVPTEWGVDMDQINQAYTYFERANAGKPYWMWEPLEANDPGRSILQGFLPPPDEVQIDDYYTNYYKQTAQAAFGGEDEQLESQNVGRFGLSDSEWEALEPWKKAALRVFGTQRGSGIATGAAAAGAEGLLRGGPKGMLVSALSGGFLGGGIAGLTEKAPGLVRMLSFLDLPAEGIERIAGTVALLSLGGLGAFEESKTGGTTLPTETLQNLGDVWKAGSLAYDVGLFGGEKAWDFGEAEERTLAPEERGYMALTEAYNRIKAGEPSDQVIADIKERMGFQGEMRDLVGHILADPLNIAGIGLAKMGAGVGKLVGTSDDFVRILSKSDGLVDGFKTFGKFAADQIDAAETPRLTKFEKWVAGMDMDGNLKRLDKPGDKPTWGIGPWNREVSPALNKIAGGITVAAPAAFLGSGFGPAGAIVAGALGGAGGFNVGASYLFSLTPAARATELADDFTHHIVTVVGNDPNLTPEQVTRYLDSIANTPREFAKEIGVRTLNSRTAELLPDMLKNTAVKRKRFLDVHRSFDDVRHFIDGVSDATQKSAGEIVKEWATLDAQSLDDAVKSFLAGADVEVTTKQVFNFLNGLKKNTVALDDVEFKHILLGQTIEDNAKFAGQYFNVKPDPLYLRMGQTIKSAQSLALLGLNPTYFLNNLFNNVVTMAAEGVFGLRKMDNIRNFTKRAGINTNRMFQGVGMSGETTFAKGMDWTKPIRDLQAADDALFKIDKLSKTVNDKIGIFSNMSGNLESWSSAQAWTAGFKKHWSQSWRRGKAFDRMPGTLETMLGPDLSSMVYEAIENGLNKAEIEDALWSGHQRKSYSAFVPEIAADFNITESQARLFLSESGLDDLLNETFKGDFDNIEAEKRFRTVFNHFDKFLDRKFGEHINHRVQKAMQQTGAEGVSSLLQMGDDLFAKRMELDVAHMNSLEEAWKSGDFDIIDDTLRQEGNAYRRHHLEEQATWMAIMKGMGLNNEQKRVYGLEFNKKVDNYKNFFETKDMMYMEFLDQRKNMTPLEAEARKVEIRQEVNELYKKMTADELEIDQNLDNMFVEQVRQQYGDEIAVFAAEWRERIRNIRQEVVADQLEIREKVMKLAPGSEEATELWQRHYHEKQKPKVLQMFEEHKQGAAELYRRAKAAEPNPNPQSGPTPETAHLWNEAKFNNDAFQNFFGNSAVVDENGVPRELYTEPRLDISPEEPLRVYTDAYELTGDGVFMRMENPYRIDAPDILETLTADDYRNISEQGYDGVIARTEEGNQLFVVWDDQQIADFNEITDWQRQHIQNISNDVHANIAEYLGETPVQQTAPKTSNRIDILTQQGKTLDDLDQQSLRDAGWKRGKKGLLNAVNKDNKELGLPEYKKYSDVPMNEAIRSMESRLGETLSESGEPPTMGMPPGFIDSFDQHPNIYEVYNEGYHTWAKPFLNKLKAKMTGPDGIYRTAVNETEVGGPTRAALEVYLDKVYGQMIDNKMAAQRVGELGRDMSLLNYSRRRGFDNFLQIAMPYHLWYGRSMVNWFGRGLDKPAYFANYARIKGMQQHAVRQPGFPQRLEGKMSIYIPFLPEGYNEIYFDPMHQLFPIEQIYNPIADLIERPTVEARKTIYVLQRMLADEQITTAQYQEAVETQNELYQQALEQARLEMDDDISNPMDFVQTLSGMSLPISIAYNAYKKNVLGKENVYNNLLPATRLLQAATSWIKPGGWTGPEGFIREAMGGNARGYLWDFYVNRELSNMVIQGEIAPEDATLAMVEKQGEAWTAAMDRVGKTQSLKLLASSFWVDVFPEGEMGARDLQAEFSQAIADNKTAEFFDAHPEYEARLMMSKWDNPDEQLRGYLKSSIWDSYFELNKYDQRRAKEQLGEDFEQLFVNKETRSYDSIPTETMLGWARQLGGTTPETEATTGLTVGEKFETAPVAEAEAYQTYYAEREEKFPDIGAIEGLYYSTEDPAMRNKIEQMFPELRDYRNWQAQYFAANKEVVPLVSKEDSWIMGIPQPTRDRMLDYQGLKAQMFPDLSETWDEYFSYPEKSQERRNMWDEHPELQQSIDFKHEYMAWYPETIPYLADMEDIAEGVLGKDWREKYSVPYNLKDKMTLEAQQALVAAELTGEITPGLEEELFIHWKEMGEPFKDFQTWLAAMRGTGF